jgi:hemoglobin
MTTSSAGEPTPYVRLGGEAGVRALVERFYDLMEMEPDFAQLRSVHGGSLASARENLFLFLSGWLGGPSLYTDRYGPPMLRARHLPFPIAITERDQWVACMRRALVDTGVESLLVDALMDAFFQTADWMRNRQGPVNKR